MLELVIFICKKIGFYKYLFDYNISFVCVCVYNFVYDFVYNVILLVCTQL